MLIVSVSTLATDIALELSASRPAEGWMPLIQPDRLQSSQTPSRGNCSLHSTSTLFVARLHGGLL